MMGIQCHFESDEGDSDPAFEETTAPGEGDGEKFLQRLSLHAAPGS